MAAHLITGYEYEWYYFQDGDEYGIQVVQVNQSTNGWKYFWRTKLWPQMKFALKELQKWSNEEDLAVSPAEME